MIPKIIHYCWFGNQKKPKSVIKMVESWSRILPEYQIVEWNESNFNVNEIAYTSEAYSLGKYAFVSDVARLKALYTYGGIYLDTDIEILKPFDGVIADYSLVLGFENGGKQIMTAWIASCSGNSLIKMLLDTYMEDSFILDSGINDIPNTNRLSNLLSPKYIVMNNQIQKFKEKSVIYPEVYFSAKNFHNFELLDTEDTYTIHHFNASWKPLGVRIKRKIKYIIIRIIPGAREHFKR